MTARLFCLLLAGLPAPLLAEAMLPPETAVRAALDSHPSVQAADARVDVAKAEARALRAGPHELNFTGSYVRRSVDREGRYEEVDATLSRAFRLPGKGRLDRQAGEHGIAAAENRAEDARHQAAIQLNDLWWDWIGASAEAAVDDQGVANFEASFSAIRRRVALRDAAQLEADQAQAALGDARAMAAQSRGRADLARSRIATRFPALPLPVEAPDADQPSVSFDELDAMGQQVIARSHEIGAADAEAARLSSLAKRAKRDRLADPSLGVRLFSERDGAERGAGLVLSLPIGGRFRAATADRASSEAQVAAADLSLVRIDVADMAQSDVTRIRSAFATWQRMREALDAQMAALQKLRQGHRLGAVDLADLLQGERLSHAAFRSEALARAEAHRAVNRLRIDSHNLWISE